MQLYNSIGPNPRAVRMFMAERGVELHKVEDRVRGGEGRKPARALPVEKPGRAMPRAGAR